MRATLVVLLLVIPSSPAAAQSPSVQTNTITLGNKDQVRQLVPPVFAPFVLDGNADLRIEIAGSADYAPHATYRGATALFGCEPAIDSKGQFGGFIGPGSPNFTIRCELGK